MRNRRQEIRQKKLIIKNARYLHDFIIAITLSTGETNLVDFLPLFQKHVKGKNIKYFAPENFKKFIVSNGNIYWGRNEDVIFPNSLLFSYKKMSKDKMEEVLYII